MAFARCFSMRYVRSLATMARPGVSWARHFPEQLRANGDANDFSRITDGNNDICSYMAATDIAAEWRDGLSILWPNPPRTNGATVS